MPMENAGSRPGVFHWHLVSSEGVDIPPIPGKISKFLVEAKSFWPAADFHGHEL